jgi:WD40 repeat protein
MMSWCQTSLPGDIVRSTEDILPDGKVLFSCVSWRDESPGRPDESVIYLWDVATGTEIRHTGMGKSRISEAILAPDGKTVATSAKDKTVRLWDFASGREVRRFGAADVETRHLAFSPDGTKLASTEVRWMDPAQFGEGPYTTPIHIWETATGRELRQWQTDNGSQVCFSPDGTTLASVGRQVIRLWDMANGQEIQPQSAGHHSAIGDAAFSPDGRSVVTVGHDRTIRFWDPSSGKVIRQLEKSDASLGFVAFLRNCIWMASGYGRQPTRLWDVASGRELHRFQLPGEPDHSFISCADLSPDGKTLATSADDGVILWDTATGQRRAGVAKSPVLAWRFRPMAKSSPRQASKTAGSACSLRPRARRSPVSTDPAVSRPSPFRPTARSWRLEPKRVENWGAMSQSASGILPDAATFAS